MMAIKSLLSSLLLLTSVSTNEASSAFSRGVAVNANHASLFGIPRGGGLFGGNKYVTVIVCA
jgi:hypothetical protein